MTNKSPEEKKNVLLVSSLSHIYVFLKYLFDCLETMKKKHLKQK